MNVVISPHFDDAIYSIGAYMTAIHRLKVFTVFGQAQEKIVTGYDAACGFGTSGEAIATRREENHRALTLYRASGVDGPFYDKQYGIESTLEQIAGWIKEQLDSAGNLEEVYIPLGIEHPDHVLCAQAALLACRRKKAKTMIYEDLPYRVQYPRQSIQRLDEISSDYHLEQVPAGGDINIKRAAVECYRSQVSDDVRPCIYVPERLWRVSWK